ncbi:MAG TPA: MFS transporter [Vicinamibacteria bacterium]|nr:MFS transporter [Vicinamibacteria bacterium]
MSDQVGGDPPAGTTGVPDPDRGAQSFADTMREYLDRRLLVIFIFGVASGFPWVLWGSAMTAWLKEAGLTRSAIGVFGTVAAAYSLQFLWAPFVDRVRVPLLGRLGQRRGWILAMQIPLALATLAIAFTHPAQSVRWTGILALVIAFCSATQDIAIDAYRIEIIPREETTKLSHASATTTAGWWTGYALLGAVPFLLADLPGWTWNRIYVLLAAMWIPIMITALLARESGQHRERFKEAEEKYERLLAQKVAPGRWARLTAWLAVTVVEPFREFFSRTGVKLGVTVMLFLFLFKLGEAFLGRMSIVFYKEVGFTDTQIGYFSKLGTAVVTIVFSMVGGLLSARIGLIRGLLVGGIAMAASNLMFSWIALVGPNQNLYIATIIVDGFTSAMSTVAFVAFISYFTSHTYTATQYALLAAIGTLGRTLVSGGSGFVVDALGGNWALFFLITALMVMPSLVLLVYVGKLLKERVRHWDDEARGGPSEAPSAGEANHDASRAPDKGRPAHA